MGESFKIFRIYGDIKEYHKRMFQNILWTLTRLQGIEIAEEMMSAISFYER